MEVLNVAKAGHHGMGNMFRCSKGESIEAKGGR